MIWPIVVSPPEKVKSYLEVKTAANRDPGKVLYGMDIPVFLPDVE